MRNFLAFIDSSSTMGWLFKASFDTTSHKFHDEVAQQLALFLIHKEQTIHAEHIPGVNNVIADILSRDTHLCNNELTLLFNSISFKQMPKNFMLVKAPRKLI